MTNRLTKLALLLALACVGWAGTARAANPQYTNAGGTGDRTASITVTTTFTGTSGTISGLVDGSQANNWYFGDDATPSGKYLRFDFGVGASKIITEAKWYQNAGASGCNMKWQGSNNATDWTDIGGVFRVGLTLQTQTSLSGNTAGYRYYQMFGADNTYPTSSNPYCREIEFKIDNYAAAGGPNLPAILRNLQNNGMRACLPLPEYAPMRAVMLAFLTRRTNHVHV